MTKNIIRNDTDKHFDISDIEDILACFVDDNGLCKTCGQDHSFRPTFEGVKTSIDDVISELFSPKKEILEAI